jgi:hypothetical protein
VNYSGSLEPPLSTLEINCRVKQGWANTSDMKIFRTTNYIAENSIDVSELIKEQ